MTQLPNILLQQPYSFPGKKTFEIAKALKPLEVEALGPCDAGLPILVERSLPLVVALKVC